MNRAEISILLVCLLVVFTIGCNQNESASEISQPEAGTTSGEVNDPLPSWNEGASKQAVLEFVSEVTNEDGDRFVEPVDRIAVFDNDGTLWAEQPVYFQLLFVMDRIRSMEADHPEWRNQQPYQAVLENDMQALGQQGMSGLMELLMATHSGMTSSEFDSIVSDWMASARHPSTGLAYTDMVYQPMLELIKFLQHHNFEVYIVSGGGIDFMRAWAEPVYGIRKDHIIGSTIKTEFDYNDGNPRILRKPEIEHIDDKEGKPVSIDKFIGRKPIFAAGNSDGDLQMLQWTDSNELPSLKVYIHHTDSAREWSYDRDSHIGQLNEGLDQAQEKGWTIVDMQTDWNKIYKAND